MNWNGLRIPIIIVTILSGLLIFFAGQFLYNKYNIERPLQDLINSNNAVSGVKMTKKSTGIYLEVALQENVTNVAEVYEDLYQSSIEILGNQPFKLFFKDNPDAKLKEVWRESQYYVHQAIMQGNFPEMVANITATADQAGVDAEVDVTESNVYVQLTNNNDYHIIAVVARQNFMITGQIAQGGGEAVVKRN